DIREGAFDTTGSSLYISSDQIAAYRKLGNEALELAFETAQHSLETRKIRLEHETHLNKTMQKQVAKQVSAQQRYHRWKQLVDLASRDPKNRKAVHTIRQSIKRPEDLYIHWDKIEGAPNPQEYGFADGNDAIYYDSQWEWVLPKLLEYQSLPHTDTGVYMMDNSLSVQFIIYSIPNKWPKGDYTMRIHAGSAGAQTWESSRTEQQPYIAPAPDASRLFLNVDSRTGLYNISTHQVRGTIEAPQSIEAVVTKDNSGHLPLFHLKERGGLENVPAQQSQKAQREIGVRHSPAIWIDYVEFEGPIFAPHSRARLNVVKQWVDLIESQDSAALRTILDQFSTAALRGKPSSPEFLTKLESIYTEFRKDEFSPRDALRETLAIILASPSFLYLSEAGSEGQTTQLTQTELASRLSYFLWSSPPDDQLLALAHQGKLSDPTVLQQQTERMLVDERSHAFYEAFLDQWLGLDRLDFFQFDNKKHPEFTAGVKSAARQEIYESFAHLMRARDNGSLSRLLHSDTVVVNSLLADLYDIPNVEGDHFRPVIVGNDSPRGGLLGMAAVAAMGSNGDHTSPVERGAWVLRKLMNNPPPPAPPNVPQLSRLGDKVLTTRERVALHQEEPQCAQCHRRIDPIGFGLENFDASGKWRILDDRHDVPADKKQIDPSGQIHKGPAFKDFYELRQIIVRDYHRAFATGFAESLGAYALGREISFTDADMIEAIVSQAQPKNYAVREFVHALIATETFRIKK
ncbi:MAG: DUF1592 domain-containing protein, partial [Verrucomicrobiota bacterium]